jgi:pilus assembly protein CpaE
MRREHGQAGIELLAVMPLLVLLALIGLQALAWARAGVAVQDAADAGARAHARGDTPDAAARTALPAGLRARARVTLDGSTVRVRVVVRPLLPLLPSLALAGAAT